MINTAGVLQETEDAYSIGTPDLDHQKNKTNKKCGSGFSFVDPKVLFS
jgi:hypothetical protein